MTARYTQDPVALVVNSHHAVRRALCEKIRASFANFRLREAASMADALAILETETIDIVLLEGDHHGINSLQATRAVLERSPQSSVIMVSGVSEPSCRSAASRAGAMAFVSRRAINSELMQVLADVLGERGRQDDPGV
ncbi:MAG TPA: response regulator [Burkholderiales bacterium]|jgi:DNA-binding NarL/FixJ family response regulator|nr:response regulator [Burkholderiales bacterium]